MSGMKELYLEIEYLLEKDMDPGTIAKKLDIPLEMVYDALEVQETLVTENYSPFSTINS